MPRQTSVYNSRMATLSPASPRAVSETPVAANPLRFDGLMAVLAIWFVGGLFVDGWAHTHNKVDQSFFTPWHALLYAGWTANASVLITGALVGRSRGRTWRTALPPGYFLSLLGAFGFGLGGLGDMAWHVAFGIERGIEALLSPSHLLLAVSMGLLVSGPFRAALRRRALSQLPAFISFALTLSVITFFTQAAHPVAQLWGLGSLHNYRDDDFAATALVLGGATFAAAALFALKIGTPMPGAFALVFGSNALLMGLLNQYVYPLKWALAFALGGLALDLLCAALSKVGAQKRRQAMAVCTPIFLIGAHFIASHIPVTSGGSTWRIHFWMGILVLTGLSGLLLSLLAERETA